MVTQEPPTSWRAVTASVRGSSHVRQSLPNQDAVVVETSKRGGLAVAVSDGHGSRDSFRSDVGAQLAAGLSARFARRILDAAEPPTLEEFDEHARAIVDRL